MKQTVEQITLHYGDTLLGGSKERCLVGMIGPLDGQTWTCKSQDSATTSLSSASTALVVYQGASAADKSSGTLSGSVGASPILDNSNLGD